MSREQTALEWLVNELELYYIGESKLVHYEIIEQAKEMEKQQIKDAYLRGIENYDPTFKNK